MAEADGQEVLVVDGDEKVQRGLAQLLSASGLVPTVMSDPSRARALAKEKFFPVAVIDLDTPQPNEGLELVRWFKSDSPVTTTYVMCSRKVFEVAVETFRAGAADLVLKAPGQVEYLQKRVVESCSTARTRVRDERLLGEALTVHEEFLRSLMDKQRRISDLEEQLGGGSHPTEEELAECPVCVIEPLQEDWLVGPLNELLRGRAGYSLTSAGSGSEGMDLAGRQHFNIALICEQLPDLPGSMVASAFKQQSPDTITILYSRPGASAGRADIVDGARTIPLVPAFSDPRQMVARLDELREAARRTRRERRYLAAFRQENYELIKKYADLKQKLTRAK
jgi:DNA-binding NtrC family response regulator